VGGAVQVVEYLTAMRQRHQGLGRAGRHVPPQLQIPYLLVANLQARLVEQLLHLGAENLLEGHLLDVLGVTGRIRHGHCCHVHNLNLIRKNRGRGKGGGSGCPGVCRTSQVSLLVPASRRRHTSHGSNQGLVVSPQLEYISFYLGKKVINCLVGRYNV
jgi:hypothetical protein